MDKRLATIVTLTLLVLIASVVGTLNAIFGFASADVSAGLALLVVLLLVCVGVVATRAPTAERHFDLEPRLESRSDSESADRLTFAHRPPQAPPPMASHIARPSLGQIGLIVGICAGVVTVVNGVIEFFSTSLHKL